MAEFTEAISAMVTVEARGYIDAWAEAEGVGVGKVIRRLLDKGIEAEELTRSLHGLGALDPEDDILRSAARRVRKVAREKVRAASTSPDGIVTLAGVDKVAPEARDYELLRALGDVAREVAESGGAKDRQADRAEHVAGETPRPPDAPAALGWHPDPKVRAARAREAQLRSGRTS